ncbi:NAD(P)H-binding protein [Ectothiorhodospira magna]|nr:NAD(P)H-binding protein [Ectothiorhodospira magna]
MIAGASGFIGAALCRELAQDYAVTALTRSQVHAQSQPEVSGVTWRHCDLYHLPELTDALKGCDYAIYLVHSLAPSSRLTQAAPRDMDLILGDNFARAAAANNVKHIIFVSGLMPDTFRISTLLWSRREVEMALTGHGIPVTILRAGLVVGPGGSACRLMVELVRRIGIITLPPGTSRRTRPIALVDLIRAIRHTLGKPEQYQGHFDLGGPDCLSYEEMLRITARLLGLRRRFLTLPWMPNTLATWAVRWITRTPKALVAPVMESLPLEVQFKDSALQRFVDQEAISFEQALDESLDHSRKKLLPSPRDPMIKMAQREIRKASRVRSIQRIIQPPGQDAAWVAGNYFRWLGSCCRPFVETVIRIDSQTGEDIGYQIYLRPGRLLLLELERDVLKGTSDRQIYRIIGGLLAKKHENHGRFEFQSVLGGRYTMAAIHDFAPSLPWYLYLFTQAFAHFLVMLSYQRHLFRLSR